MRWKERWSFLPAFDVEEVRDAAGSGDWCSGALIHTIGRAGRAGLARLRRTEVENGLRLGQGLAALNCMLEGARGLMNVKDVDSANLGLRVLQETSRVPNDWEEKEISYSAVPEKVCQLCKPRLLDNGNGDRKRASRLS